MSAERKWRTPTVELVRRLPSIDSQRWLVEFEAQQKYMAGVHADDLLEAVHRCVVDLLDSDHTPSRNMLRMISGELKAAWWPDRKQHQHSKEAAFLVIVQQEIDYRWETQYGKARGARTKAEADVADMRGLSVSGLRKRRVRYRARRKERAAELERQRKRPLRK